VLEEAREWQFWLLEESSRLLSSTAMQVVTSSVINQDQGSLSWDKFPAFDFPDNLEYTEVVSIVWNSGTAEFQ
jgi:hypothetical protein